MSDNTTNPYNRPMAKFTGDRIEVRASALGRCRRALWYSATEQPVTNPTSSESLTIVESGNALEPVVVRAMQRAGWAIQPVDRDAPTSVSVEVGDTLVVSGHPDATGFLPKTPAEIMAIDEFLFDGERTLTPDDDPVVIEVKTRGPEAFKRWQTLGSERSHPDSVAQAACYTLGLFGECRDVVIATLDTGSRRWDYELIPAERVEQAWRRATSRLKELADHFDANGPDPDALPERDFEATDWQCRSCPYLDWTPASRQSPTRHRPRHPPPRRPNPSLKRRHSPRCGITRRSRSCSSRSMRTSASRSKSSSGGSRREASARPSSPGATSRAPLGWSRLNATKSTTSDSTRCSTPNSAPKSSPNPARSISG